MNTKKGWKKNEWQVYLLFKADEIILTGGGTKYEWF